MSIFGKDVEVTSLSNNLPAYSISPWQIWRSFFWDRVGFPSPSNLPWCTWAKIRIGRILLHNKQKHIDSELLFVCLFLITRKAGFHSYKRLIVDLLLIKYTLVVRQAQVLQHGRKIFKFLFIFFVFLFYSCRSSYITVLCYRSWHLTILHHILGTHCLHNIVLIWWIPWTNLTGLSIRHLSSRQKRAILLIWKQVKENQGTCLR